MNMQHCYGLRAFTFSIPNLFTSSHHCYQFDQLQNLISHSRPWHHWVFSRLRLAPYCIFSHYHLSFQPLNWDNKSSGTWNQWTVNLNANLVMVWAVVLFRRCQPENQICLYQLFKRLLLKKKRRKNPRCYFINTSVSPSSRNTAVRLHVTHDENLSYLKSPGDEGDWAAVTDVHRGGAGGESRQKSRCKDLKEAWEKVLHFSTFTFYWSSAALQC